MGAPVPDRGVSTIGDLIYYQYAIIIAKSAFGVPDGREAEGGQDGSVKERFRGLGGESRIAGRRGGGRREVTYLLAEGFHAPPSPPMPNP
jgi:hypothetical protein